MKYIIMLFIVLKGFSAFATEDPKTIFDAIVNGNTVEVRQMVNAKKNIEIRDTQGRTPLMLAAEQADMESVKILLQAGADINAKDRGFTVIDKLESILRRTGNNKKRIIEMMRKDGFSEQLIQSLENDTATLHDSPENIRKWENILKYLKEANVSNIK